MSVNKNKSEIADSFRNLLQKADEMALNMQYLIFHLRRYIKLITSYLFFRKKTNVDLVSKHIIYVLLQGLYLSNTKWTMK